MDVTSAYERVLTEDALVLRCPNMFLPIPENAGSTCSHASALSQHTAACVSTASSDFSSARPADLLSGAPQRSACDIRVARTPGQSLPYAGLPPDRCQRRI
jgi:hypothetical protein